MSTHAQHRLLGLCSPGPVLPHGDEAAAAPRDPVQEIDFTAGFFCVFSSMPESRIPESYRFALHLRSLTSEIVFSDMQGEHY